MACIDEIVTLGVCPDDGVPTSGFTLLQAAGMSAKIFANIANETYISGAQLAMGKKALAINQVRNDFIGALQSNAVMANMAVIDYNSSRFNPGVIIPASSLQRGLTVHKTSRRGGLRKTYIKNIQVYPLDSGEATIIIGDGYTETQYEVELVANQVNTFVSGYEVIDSTALITIDAPGIRFASATVICHKGCGGQIPNDCAWVDGWDGTRAVKSESYGLNIQFYCKCDYDTLLCQNSYIGEILWLKWQYLIFDEQYKTNRFNNWVTYGRDQLPDIIAGVNSQYVAKWNEMMSGLYGWLNQYKDSCLECRGVRRKINV